MEDILSRKLDSAWIILSDSIETRSYLICSRRRHRFSLPFLSFSPC